MRWSLQNRGSEIHVQRKSRVSGQLIEIGKAVPHLDRNAKVRILGVNCSINMQVISACMSYSFLVIYIATYPSMLVINNWVYNSLDGWKSTSATLLPCLLPMPVQSLISSTTSQRQAHAMVHILVSHPHQQMHPL